MKGWDYTNPWWYYVTICTKHHKEYFGEIINSKMVLNKYGIIVDEELKRTEEIRDNVELDYYVIMPNHVHFIIILNNIVETTGLPAIPLEGSVVSKDNEATHRVASTKIYDTGRIASTTLQANSLGAIIGQFKSVCTKRIRKSGKRSFHWQSRFYDRIIRNDRELYQIRKYIEQNPIKWDIDKSTPENIDLIL